MKASMAAESSREWAREGGVGRETTLRQSKRAEPEQSAKRLAHSFNETRVAAATGCEAQGAVTRGGSAEAWREAWREAAIKARARGSHTPWMRRTA